MSKTLQAATLTLALLASSCSCDETSEYLTLGVMSYVSESSFGATTPRWEGVYEHPEMARFQATLTWAPKDPEPGNDAWEMYLTTGGALEPLELYVADCVAGDSNPEAVPLNPTCASFDSTNSCPFENRAFEPVEPLTVNNTYLIVFYPERGNGRQLSWDGEREEFDGREALTMDLVVTEDANDRTE